MIIQSTIYIIFTRLKKSNKVKLIYIFIFQNSIKKKRTYMYIMHKIILLCINIEFPFKNNINLS